LSSGIYKITIDRWFYYGQTNNFSRRKSQHLSELKKAKHVNPILQNAYNKHKLFEFEICCEVEDPEKLTELEQLIIDEAIGKLYCANICNIAAVPPSTKGKKLGPRSEETKAKISASHKGTTFSEEHKAKLREARARQVRKPHSEEAKAKMSKARKLYLQTKKENV
jgi:group I intron endonuclease